MDRKNNSAKPPQLAHPVVMVTEHAGLRVLVGREVSSVEFVRGYVQIRFDGPCLSAFTLPTVEDRSGHRYGPSDVGYAGALIGMIGKEVEEAWQSSDAVQIRIRDGSTLCVSLSEELRETPEAAVLDGAGSSIWTW